MRDGLPVTYGATLSGLLAIHHVAVTADHRTAVALLLISLVLLAVRVSLPRFIQ
jgi:hypothetical protein